MLILVEIEGEHDAVRTLDELTASAREQGTELAVVGSVAKDDVVAGALQEPAVELGPAARRDVDEDRPLWLVHRATSARGSPLSMRDGADRRQGRTSLRVPLPAFGLRHGEPCRRDLPE